MKKIAICLLLIGTLPRLAHAQGKASPPDKPNILFIYVDDWGWTDLSSAGSKYYETPHIDKLLRESVQFTQAYSVGPNCAPSRASLMTGKYPPRHGIYTVGNAERGDSTKRKLIPVKNNTVLNPSFVTIAEELKNTGYATGLIGKWQLGETAEGTGPQAQGFDFCIGGSEGTPSYFYPYKKAKAAKTPHQGLESGKEGEYLTDRLTDEAVKYIGSQKENPFFLYLSYFAVHTPTEAKASIIDKYKAKKGDQFHNNPTYAAMIESVDQGIGRVLKTLDSLKLTNNTLIVFYSDNGGMGAVTSQYPLRGSKGMLYEGGIRVPLLVKWAGNVRPGRQTDTPVIGIDFYPTLLDIARVQKPLNKDVDGQSFLPVLLDEKPAVRDALFWHFPAYLEATKGDSRVSDSFRTRPVSTIRSGDFKLHEFYEDGRQELYNLKEDIGESTNLATKNPAKVKELHDKLDAWKKKTKAPIPTQPNPAYRPL
ncbi:MAG: sulfatase [Spirosoma sp.]|nr:sulfatase [Spirosoma sp.]